MPRLPEIWIPKSSDAQRDTLGLSFAYSEPLNQIYRELGGQYSKKLGSWILKDNAIVRKEVYQACQSRVWLHWPSKTWEGLSKTKGLNKPDMPETQAHHAEKGSSSHAKTQFCNAFTGKQHGREKFNFYQTIQTFKPTPFMSISATDLLQELYVLSTSRKRV